MITALPRIAIAIHDFPQCLATFRDVLGMPVVDLSERSVASLGAKVAMCVPEGGAISSSCPPLTPTLRLATVSRNFLRGAGRGCSP